MRRFLLLPLLIPSLFFPRVLFGEEEEVIPLQSVTFFILGSAVDPETSLPDVVFQFEDEQGVNGVSMQPGGMAGPFLRPLHPEFLLFREERIPAPDDAPPDTPPTVVRHPLRQVEIPVDWRNVFLLIHVDSTSGQVRNIVPLNQSTDALPEGHLALINYLDREVNVQLGEASGNLPPGERRLFPAKRRSGPRGDMVLFLAGARDSNGEMQVIASRRISVNPNFRRLALLMPDAGGTLQIIVLPPAPDDPPLPEPQPNP